MWHTFLKKEKKKRRSLFKLNSHVLSPPSAQKFRSFSPSLSHVAIPFFFLTIEAPSKLQPLHTISAPNRERKPFSES